jgi:hypothetical protein
MKDEKKSVSNVEKIVKETHGFEADSWIGVDSAPSSHSMHSMHAEMEWARAE